MTDNLKNYPNYNGSENKTQWYSSKL